MATPAAETTIGTPEIKGQDLTRLGGRLVTQGALRLAVLEDEASLSSQVGRAFKTAGLSMEVEAHADNEGILGAAASGEGRVVGFLPVIVAGSGKELPFGPDSDRTAVAALRDSDCRAIGCIRVGTTLVSAVTAGESV